MTHFDYQMKAIAVKQLGLHNAKVVKVSPHGIVLDADEGTFRLEYVAEVEQPSWLFRLVGKLLLKLLPAPR
jgi:hypothetical protein